MKVRLSKKFVLIIGGVFVLCGASGAAAYFMTRQSGDEKAAVNTSGTACTLVENDRFQQDRLNWQRQYVTSDEASDGVTRIRTALRIARLAQQKHHPDIIQVAMLDKAGPTERAEMRGRMIGAQVVYIPDPKRAPHGIDAKSFSAFYIEGEAGADGQFYGQRVDMPEQDVEALLASLTDGTDCRDPKAEAAAAAAAALAAENGGHGAAPKSGGHAPTHGTSHGAAPAKEGADAHGAATDAHGEKPAAEGHGERPVADAHGATPATAENGGHGASGEGAAESKGLLASLVSPITGLFSSSPATPAAEPAGEHTAEGAHGAAPEAVAKPAAEAKAPAGHDEAAKPADQAAAPAAEDKGLFDQVKSMIFGGGEGTEKSHEETVVTPVKPAVAAGEDHAAEKMKAPDAASEKAPAARADEAAHANKQAAPAPVPAAGDGNSAADAAGQAWLAKFRAKQAGATAPAEADKPQH